MATLLQYKELASFLLVDKLFKSIRNVARHARMLPLAPEPL